MKITTIGVAAALIWSLTTAGGAGEAPREVVFAPQWTPQAQFAGYYMAVEKGFYEARGLKVDIDHCGPDESSMDKLRGGKVDFATMFLSSAIVGRAQGVPLVNIAQTSSRSALIVICRSESKIDAPADMTGKRVGLWRSDFQSVPRAFFKKHGARPRIVPVSNGVVLFLRGGVDLLTVMWYNEYHRVLNAGVDPDELKAFHLADYGLNVPEDGVYCLETTRRERPELCADFVEATRLGWRYALDHVEETLDVVIRRMKAAHLPANRAHQRWMLNRVGELMGAGSVETKGKAGGKDVSMSGVKRGTLSFSLSPEAYELTADVLLKDGSISRIPSYESFYQPVVGNVQK